MVRSVVVEVLEEAGYTVISVANGEDAVDAFRRNEREIDLLLFDIVMPRLDGPEALERIRQLDPHVRAAICTGHGDAQQGASGAGDTPVLRKPYKTHELLARIRSELERDLRPA
jgi:CheY-like chemotaxis protein